MGRSPYDHAKNFMVLGDCITARLLIRLNEGGVAVSTTHVTMSGLAMATRSCNISRKPSEESWRCAMSQFDVGWSEGRCVLLVDSGMLAEGAAVQLASAACQKERCCAARSM